MGAAFQCTLGTGSQVPGVTGTPRSDHGQLMVLMLATLQGCPEGFGWAPGWHFWPTALPSRDGLLLPSVLPEWPPGRTAVSGPPAGAPPATRGGLGSAPPRPLASAPLPICCPHLFADRPHVSKCASLPSRPPPQIPQQTRQHPQAAPRPPPALALSLAFGARPPARLCVRSEFFLHWRKDSSFSLGPRSVPTQGPSFRVGCGSGHPPDVLPGEGSGSGLEPSPCQAGAPTAASCPI